ncbi:hypothetical protein [Comamonas jiangduensis]|jgi:hypothetical protein|nr:hypothetical protein [Comamonas jiangduensis]
MSPGSATTLSGKYSERFFTGLAVGHYQPWLTAMHCTLPEPRHLLLSGCQKTLEKLLKTGFLVRSVKATSTSAKGWSAFTDTPASGLD